MKFQYNIVCVGCGGTGGFFIKEFARFMASFKCEDHSKKIYLALVDGDSVDLHNLERQAFIRQDLHSNKALTLAGAIRDNFGLQNVFAFPEYIEEVSHLYKIFRSLGRQEYEMETDVLQILIGCVDNHRARQVMHQYFNEYRGTIFYIDAANEFDRGEVVIGGRHRNKLLGHPRGFFFPNVLTDTSPRASEMSCTNVNDRAPQHIATNMMAGNILLSAITSLISRNKIQFGITYFDAFKMEMIFHSTQKALEEE